jgi:hypothetical protein
MHLLGLLTRLGIHLDAPDPPGFAALHDRWHDFFLMSGTAAVTLAGLLFVSMSFNMEHLLRADRQPAPVSGSCAASSMRISGSSRRSV